MATTKVSTDVIDMSGNTGGLTWVKGTTGEQPAGALGELRVNTTTKKTQIYTDVTGTSSWQNLKESTATFDLDFLVVAGGGGGDFDERGGGGAGGLRTSYGSSSGGGASSENSFKTTLNTDYNVTVGAGGTGGQNSATSGENSQFATIISIGGGTPVLDGSYKAGSGGSGAGAMGWTSSSPTIIPGDGTAVQGFAGGNGAYRTASNEAGGGGGGAGGVGLDGSNSGTGTGGDGGAGLDISITGSSVGYAGGGGGGGRTTGGSGNRGGANGTGAANPSNATANTGGGGGSAGGNTGAYTGGNGGSGIVVLRYPDSFTLTVGSGSLTTGQLNTAVGTDEKYTTFTGGTGKISFS